ncbi:MAG TPA: hypothetical protein VMU04_03760 [Candidatus Acidoferrum sp.]|nr:hypothetical protein [Candidatus Acidoferrum sp.]
MKRLLFIAALVALALPARAASTIDPANRYAYGANLGWMDWLADTNHGAVIGEYVCSGYIYAANAGWINLGSGAPTNQIYYQNLSANDFGVNQDGLGNLRGYAYGANIGWVNFESTGAPKVDLQTGRLTGSIWSANCGWISLSNSYAVVQTDTIAPGAMDSNGLPVAWELLNFGHTGVDPNADPDHDGMSNLEEYLAGTDPNNAGSRLAITAFGSTPEGTAATVMWSSVTSRYYYLQERASLSPGSPWTDSGLGLITPDGATTTRTTANSSAPMRYYRVLAVRPLGY